MIAIYKKELRQYFNSMIGFAFLAFFLAIIGIYTWVYNFVGGLGNFEVTLGSISFLFVILVPILTMRIVAEENHQKTNQLLYTAPVSITKIILGKYASVLTLFLAGVVVICFYPLIIHMYGSDVRLATAYSSLIGFFLLGAACMAVGLFISALTESQAIAAVVTFIVLLVSFLMSSITGQIPSDALTQCVLLAVLWAVVAMIVQYMVKKPKLTIGVFAVGEIVLWVVYFLKSSVYEGLVNTILNVFAIADKFDDFELGIINYDAVLYYVSVIFLFMFLTIQIIRTQQFKQGAYSSILIVLVIAVVVVVNLVFTKLELSTDISTGGLFTLSEDTKEAIEDLDQEITIYYMVAEGEETSYIENVIKQYKKLDNITVKTVDPVVNPGFASKHGIDDEVTSNDVIVENSETSTAQYISYSDMYYYEYTSSGSYSYYLDVEGQVTSAVLSVASGETSKMYVLTKHDEQELGDTLYDALEKMNIETEDLELATSEDGVPDDCDILLINGPAVDLTSDEKDSVLAYLAEGGAAFLNVCYSTEDMPNYEEILTEYGVTVHQGVLFEGSGHYMSYINYIVPSTSSYSGLLSDLDGYILFPSAVGLTTDDDSLRDTVTITELLTTSDSSFVKVDPSSGETEKEDADEDGPFSVGLYITEDLSSDDEEDEEEATSEEDVTSEEDTTSEDEESDASEEESAETKIIVYSCAYAFTEDLTYSSQIENANVFTESISELTETDVQTVSVDAKDLSYTYVSVTPAMQSFWAAVMIIILPAGLLIIGFVIWICRRRK